MLKSEAQKKILKTEGGYLNKAEKDAKTIRTSLRGCKAIRKDFAAKLKEIKVAMKTAVGAEYQELYLKRVYYRDQLIEQHWAHVTGKENLRQCNAYIKQQKELVVTLDAIYEEVKAGETAEAE